MKSYNYQRKNYSFRLIDAITRNAIASISIGYIPKTGDTINIEFRGGVLQDYEVVSRDGECIFMKPILTGKNENAL